MRELGTQEVEDIALGAALMASGGGGNPYMGTLIAKQMVVEHGPIQLLALEELDDDALVAVSMGLGAPTVLVEKIPAGPEAVEALEVLEQEYGASFDALLPSEAGGWNSLHPMLPAAQRHLPLLDADGMGRAFPELQMVTWSLFGQSCNPIGIADERHSKMLVHASTNKMGEDICRGLTVELGGNISMACYPMTGREAKEHSVAGTYTLCERVGRTIRTAHRYTDEAFSDLLDILGAVELFRGKVVDVERRTTGGFARGVAALDGMDGYKGSGLQVRFQNEYLIAEVDGQVVCTAPDLIAMLDVQTMQPITGESLKYGQRAVVIGIPSAPQWRTPEGLEVVGPAVFGYPDIEFVPVEQRAAR
jgi:DUF917 family protein